MYTPGDCSIFSASLKLERLSLTIFVWPGFIVNFLSGIVTISEILKAPISIAASSLPIFITLNSFSMSSPDLTRTFIRIWSTSKETVDSSAAILLKTRFLFWIKNNAEITISNRAKKTIVTSKGFLPLAVTFPR